MREETRRRPYIAVKNRTLITKVLLDEILYIQRDGRKLDMATDAGIFSWYETVQRIEPVLDDRFYRSMTGCYVNLERIKTMGGDCCIQFENGAKLYLGRDNYIRTKQRFFQFLKSLEGVDARQLGVFRSGK